MRTDLTVVPNPPVEMMQQWSKANSLGLDTDFSTRILRVTDPSTCVGKPIFTSDAGQANLWNTNSTMFVLKAAGGQKLVFTFDPLKMQAKFTNQSLTGDVCFSRTTQNRFYVIQGTVVTAWNFRRVLGLWTFISKQKVCDFANILPAGFTPNWNGVFGVSVDDSTFSFAFSDHGQDTGCYVAVFKRGKGYRLWNTQTGEVSGTYGVKGKITMPPFTLHETYQTPSSSYTVVMATSAQQMGFGPLFWNVDTLMVYAGKLSGHAIHGTSTYRSGGPGGGQWAEIQYASPQTKRLIVPPMSLPVQLNVGQHGSLNVFTGGDVNPFVVSWANKGPVTSAWQGEIVQIFPMSGVVQRICHHFASETSAFFDVANAMAIQSQDGKWVMFCSDLLGTIKGDVFIAPLQTPFM